MRLRKKTYIIGAIKVTIWVGQNYNMIYTYGRLKRLIARTFGKKEKCAEVNTNSEGKETIVMETVCYRLGNKLYAFDTTVGKCQEQERNKCEQAKKNVSKGNPPF